MKGMITAERKCYNLKVVNTRKQVIWVHFCAGWTMICFLSNINAEAQKN